MRFTGGYAAFKDYDALLARYEALDVNDIIGIRKGITEQEDLLASSHRNTPLHKAVETFMHLDFSRRHSLSLVRSGDEWALGKQDTLHDLEQFHVFATEYGQRLRVLVWNEGVYAAVYIGNPERSVIVVAPEQYLTYEPEQDYSDVTPAAFRIEKGLDAPPVSAIVPIDAQNTMTVTSAKAALAAHEAKMAEMDEHYKLAQDGESEELVALKRQLEDLQRELREKKSALLEQLEEKKAEMELEKAKLESQVFMLSSEIYCIECYMGETVRFAKIRSGKDAPDDEPIVVHQKLRYLDEDLGLLASIYEINWNEIDMFENFLRYSPYALDTFAPSPRCVMLVRLSKNAYRLGKSKQPFSNILDYYEVYHGRTVGIIIRNGDNLYLGWTDESRVHIKDDLVLTAAQVHTETVPYDQPEFRSKTERDKWLKEQIETRQNILDGLASRSFVFNILQGVVDHTNMLPLPTGVKINKQSEYVVFSVADKWLSDNKYGSFSDLVDRCNKAKAVVGDKVLTLQHLVPERMLVGYRYVADNDRGIGYNDRLRDVSVDDCTIYPVNKVVIEKPRKRVRYRFRMHENDDWMESTCLVDMDQEPNLSSKCEILGYSEYVKRNVYVSLVKTDVFRPWYKPLPTREPRANFKLHDNEFVNLNYMNSTWLEYVARTKKIGRKAVGGNDADYATLIRYIKTALDFVRKREVGEREAIESISPGFCDAHSDWPAWVSEFKLAKDVHDINAYQAKRFVKWYENKAMKGEKKRV